MATSHIANHLTRCCTVLLKSTRARAITVTRSFAYRSCCARLGTPLRLLRAFMEVVVYRPGFAADVLGLILEIQRDEFGIDITARDQPDLLDIAAFYQVRSGNFWVALAGQQVVGTIALLDIGHGQAALRKMFVRRAFRGSQSGVARRLLEAVLEWSREKALREIFLGTTPKFFAAHRFYEKNGFSEIAESDLPASFPIMAVDKKFYRLAIDACVQ